MLNLRFFSLKTVHLKELFQKTQSSTILQFNAIFVLLEFQERVSNFRNFETAGRDRIRNSSIYSDRRIYSG